MKRNRIKKTLILIFFCIFISLSACGANLQQGPNPNVENDFKSYYDNKTLAKDNQGFCDDLSYIVDNNTYEIDGKGILWGDIELLKVNASEEDNFQINGTIQINNGNYKIIQINSQNEVTVLLEDEESFDKSIVLEKGMNIIKIVGKPANFNLLDLKIAIPKNVENINSRLPLAEQIQDTDYSNKNNIEKVKETENTDKVQELESVKIEEGDFRCVSYLQEGNILLSGKLTTLNGNKVLLDLDLKEEFDLYVKIRCKLKGGNYNLVLQDGKGNQKTIVSDEEKWEGNIILGEGLNTITLIGDNASFDSITIESNSEEINPEDVKH